VIAGAPTQGYAVQKGQQAKRAAGERVMINGSRTDDLFIHDWIAENAWRTPDKLATIDLHSGRRHSYAQMHERVARIAGHLTSLGVVKGDRVAMLSMNSSDFLDILFAVWRIGAVLTPLNFRLTAHELSYMVNDSGAKLLFYDLDLARFGQDNQRAALDCHGPAGQSR
jgi:fatty-acyl-CoA synthase